MNYWILFIIFIAFIVFGVFLNKRGRSDSEALPYKKKEYLMTKAEREFFDVLERVVTGRYYIVPQVKISNIAFVSSGKNRQAYLNKIDRKTIDFVLFDKQFSPIIAIELDDSSHDNEDRKIRDGFVDKIMETIGLKIVHVKTASTYNLEELNDLIFKNYGK